MFASGGKINEATVYAECAGISELQDEQRNQVQQPVDSILPPSIGEHFGATNLIGHQMFEVAHEEVKKILVQDIIERSASDWSSTPVIIRKPDGSYRFCVDYRELNKVTKKDAYPIPNMDSILDKLGKAKYIIKIDLKQACFQVPMEIYSRKYTAFSVPGLGLWQFERLAFGLTNAPITFQRLVDAIYLRIS